MKTKVPPLLPASPAAPQIGEDTAPACAERIGAFFQEQHETPGLLFGTDVEVVPQVVFCTSS